MVNRDELARRATVLVLGRRERDFLTL